MSVDGRRSSTKIYLLQQINDPKTGHNLITMQYRYTMEIIFVNEFRKMALSNKYDTS